MRSAEQRIASYNARMQSSQIDPTLSAVQSLAQANFAAYVVEFYPYQVQLRAILNGLGVDPAVFAGYEAFNGQAYRIYKTTAGDSAIAAAKSLVALWKARGLTEAKLKLIFEQIYSIVIPAAP